MRSDVVALSLHVPISTLANFECSEIVLFTYRILASSTRHFPPETPVAVLA
jgi:hypothetical protein